MIVVEVGTLLFLPCLPECLHACMCMRERVCGPIILCACCLISSLEKYVNVGASALNWFEAIRADAGYRHQCIGTDVVRETTHKPQ